MKSSPDSYHDIELGAEPDIREVSGPRLSFVSVAATLVLVMFVLLSIAVLLVSNDKQKYQTTPKNLIFVLADGMSPDSLTYAREMSHFDSGNPSLPLPLDQYLVGHARTFSADMVITDSAAGATAYSCQQLTLNDVVAVTPEGRACATLFEAAKMEGFLTGVVTNTRVTHATPAAFTAHVAERDFEQDIATQQTYNFSKSMDLLMGGGKSKFTNRDDGVNLVDVFEEDGVKVIYTPEELKELNELPVVGLFADSHLDYELDRMQNHPRTQPSLSEMVAKSLELFEQDGRKFILFIESGKIDLSAHANDAGSHYWEMNQYMKTVEVLEDFINTNSETAVFFTSDHATGGISTGRRYNNDTYPEYTWFPDVVLRQTQSNLKMAQRIEAGEDLETVYLEETGIDLTAHPEEYALLQNVTAEDSLQYQSALGFPLSSEALIGWTTIGHTGVDVNTYRFGVDIPRIKGVMQNTKIGEILAETMGLVDVLEELNKEYGLWEFDMNVTEAGAPTRSFGPRGYHDDL